MSRSTNSTSLGGFPGAPAGGGPESLFWAYEMEAVNAAMTAACQKMQWGIAKKEKIRFLEKFMAIILRGPILERCRTRCRRQRLSNHEPWARGVRRPCDRQAFAVDWSR